MLRKALVAQKSKRGNPKEVLCYCLPVHVSDSLCYVQTFVVSNLFFQKYNTHGKNILKKEKQCLKLKERDPRYANHILTC